jgi:hypothetical protein
MAQHDKGTWFVGASSSSLGFNSNTGSERNINVNFTGFQDTLVAENEFLNLASVFPYTYQVEQDKNSQLDLNFRLGYTLVNNFVFGIGFGYDNETNLFKTKVDPDLATHNPDSLNIITALSALSQPTNLNGVTHTQHYRALYSLLAGQNDLTIKSSTFKIAPFVRYYHTLGKGSLFVDASYEIGQGTEEIKDDLNYLTTTTEHAHSKINFGLGYAVFLSDHISIEPQFNYYMLNTSSKLVEDVPNPMLFTTDMGTKTTEGTRKSSGMNFAVGLSFYL